MSQPLAIEILQTKQWLQDIVIDLNFCPFAKKEFVNNTIYYHLSPIEQMKLALAECINQCNYLEQHPEIETTLIIFSDGFRRFDRYLTLIEHAEELLYSSGFEGVFQLASLHPDYCFAGEDYDDAANYTNRSPYPTIHIIREASLERVLKVYKNPEDIPHINVDLARIKGRSYFVNKLDEMMKRHS